MIDFEQLKIDNVNLNEKIEERNEVCKVHLFTSMHNYVTIHTHNTHEHN